MSEIKRRLIAVLMDRSGSMQSIKTDVEGGLVAFLDEQKAADAKLTAEGVANETHVVLADFDNYYRRVFGPVELADAPAYVLEPGGSTALYDSILQIVKDIETGQSWMLHKSPLDEAVTVVVFTDGQENVSKASSEDVKKVLEAKQEAGWQVLFIGANQDAVLEAGKIGISRDRSITYAATNSMDVLRSVGANVAHSYVANASVAFTDAERDAAVNTSTTQ